MTKQKWLEGSYRNNCIFQNKNTYREALFYIMQILFG